MGSGTIIKGLVKKHGRGAFTKEILGYYPDADALNAAEAALITEETLKDPLCVNLKTGGECGRPSDETRARMSKSQRNRPPLTEETKEKISKAKLNITAETRAKLSAAQTGRTHSAETRAKISEAIRNRPPISEETRTKMSAAARNMSDEHRAKLSESRRRQPPISIETRAKKSEAMRAAWARRKAAA